jgi:LytR cell envelope-related transcriptional attenuator
MGELETTGGTGGPGGGGFDPPRGDEGLDDWFARRLEAQGITANRPGFPTARILAVLGLVAALGALFWVITSAGSGGSTSVTSGTTQPSATTTPTTTTGGTTGGKQNGAKVDWRTIPITVLNGYGATGAAGATQQQLTSQGWKVIGASNAATSSVTQTIVVYSPGKLAAAKVVAKRLHLPAPVAFADVTGVGEAPASGVAILLGSDGLPAVAG